MAIDCISPAAPPRVKQGGGGGVKVKSPKNGSVTRPNGLVLGRVTFKLGAKIEKTITFMKGVY